MKKIILIVTGIFLFIFVFLPLAIPRTEKTVKTPPDNTSIQLSATQIINTVTVAPTITVSQYMTKEEYGRGVVSVSEKTLEAQGLISLATTLKTQSRYDEALEKLKEAEKLFLEAKAINDTLKPPPRYQKSYDYYVKAFSLDLESIKLEIRATEHFKTGEIELSNLELKQALDLRKEAMSYSRLSTNAMQ